MYRACAFLLVTALSFSARAQAGNSVSAANNRLRVSDRIHASVYGSPDFESTIEQSFPGLSQQTGFDEVRPFLILLHNQSRHAVSAFVVRWHVSYSSGPDRILYYYGLDDSGQRLISPAMTVVLRPGETQLVSPSAAFSRHQFLASAAHSRSLFTPVLVANRSAFAHVSKVFVTLDGAVFDDNRFAGRNSAHLLERFQAESLAEHDETLSVREALGTSNAEATKTLEAHVQQWGTTTDDTAKGIYLRARADDASALLTLLHHGSSQQVLAVVARGSSAQPVTLVAPHP